MRKIALQQTTRREGHYASNAPHKTWKLYRAWPHARSCFQPRPRLRAGQDLRAETLALGAAVASAAKIHGGVGRLDRKGFRRHHQIQGLSGAAARQGVRPL